MTTATYSPEDNKLRIYPATRLDKATYDRVVAAGFRWASKQGCFVAPAWSPDREDLAAELAGGEVEDEDKSLVERAEERAERFGDYSDKRLEDAVAARKAVSAIADNIPLGQPILVGHHSERRARKDAQRIENGMRRSVRMWETAEYWKQRAAGAIRHAKYKERPDVRARRIKKLEADKRRVERSKAEHEFAIKFWRGEMKVVRGGTGEKRVLPIVEEERETICNILGSDSRLGYLPIAKHPTLDQHWTAWDVLRPDEERCKECPSMTVAEVQAKALEHYPMLVARCDRWIAHYANRIEYEKAMLQDSGGTVADRNAPEVGGGVRCWASPRGGGWSYVVKVNKVSVTVADNWGNGGKNFTRTIPFDKLKGIMSKAQVEDAMASGLLVDTGDGVGFHVCDASPKETPPKYAEPPNEKEAKAPTDESVGALFRQTKDLLSSGSIVKVVVVQDLFPTPDWLADKMAEELCANDSEGRRSFLEPSAGTGSLVRALTRIGIHRDWITAFERDSSLAKAGGFECADFLDQTNDSRTFDRILMNPPFSNAVDILHIEMAVRRLNRGGRLVALCADGPRQRNEFLPMTQVNGELRTCYQSLGSGIFEGTGVNVAKVTIYRS